jgi:4-amino-4-deoxy-L-arabinose transferase-like glycosyltransferase
VGAPIGRAIDGCQPEEATARLRRRIRFFFLLFLACTGLALLNVYPGDVHQNAAEIYMWSTLGFKLIYAKHPPLLPWIVGALNQLVSVNFFVLAALSAFNVTIAAYAVWRIACLTVGEARAMLVVAIYLLSPYTLWHGVKFDHNAILLSTWPFVVWAFLLSLEDPKWWRGLVLGLAGAAAIYAKYTSALLLIAVAVAALASPRRTQYFRAPAPCVALASLILLVAPLTWAVLAIEAGQVTRLIGAVPIGTAPIYMLATNLLRLLPVLAGFALLYWWVGSGVGEKTAYMRELLVIVFLSYALIVATSVALGLRGSQAWTMPVFAFVPILLVSLLRSPFPNQSVALYRAAPFLLCVIPMVGVLMLLNSFRLSNHNIVDPTWEVASEGASIWASALHRPVGIVAGDGVIDFSGTLVLSDHPRAWAGFSDAWWVTPELIDKYGVLAFCRERDTACNSRANDLIGERKGWSCDIEARRFLLGMAGPLLRVKAYFVPPKGSDAEQICMGCDAVWIKAANGTNSLSYEKAISYILDLKVADPDDDGVFTKKEFIDACTQGLVQIASHDKVLKSASSSTQNN